LLPRNIHCEIVNNIGPVQEIRNIAQISKYWRLVCLLNPTYRKFVVFFNTYTEYYIEKELFLNVALRYGDFEIAQYLYDKSRIVNCFSVAENALLSNNPRN
jgi:hypothetical protein